ncbi:MAG: redoxin domain-containing protein [Candidatus Lokiarchaeota archaeon]|nr:redoxin domain-containing protein [Candidatus Lokiarchaeota archaeon]MBD3201442.1 redoxin domain-containing protein [Candidatus Lokiarchaeota archaeon]
MGELRRDYEKFQENNTELYPILVDKKENAEKMEKKYARNKFPIFYDEEEKVAKMLNQEKKLLKLGRLPGLLVLNKENVIQYAYYSDSMKDIPENDVIFEVISNLNN